MSSLKTALVLTEFASDPDLIEKRKEKWILIDYWKKKKKKKKKNELNKNRYPGSVKANAAISSPAASLGKYFAFCCSFPTRRIPLNPIDWWAPK